jgi:hypothetical protein
MDLYHTLSQRRMISQLKNFNTRMFLLLPFLRVLKGYSTLREGICVLCGERVSIYMPRYRTVTSHQPLTTSH